DGAAWPAASPGESDRIFSGRPTFSSSKRADDFDMQGGHVALLRSAVARLSTGGVLYFCHNFRRFRLDEDAVAQFAQCEEISAETIPPDFARHARIHRCWRLTRI